MAALPPDVNVRPPQSNDVMADELSPPRPDSDEPIWRRTVVAERGGLVVGAAEPWLPTPEQQDEVARAWTENMKKGNAGLVGVERA